MATKTKAKRPASTKPKLPAKYAWLRKMRKLLAKPDGWVQRRYHSSGGYCLIGARLAANGLNPDDAEGHYRMAAADVARALCIQQCEVEGDFGAVADWNDDPRRTQEQVIARIDAAIRRLSR